MTEHRAPADGDPADGDPVEVARRIVLKQLERGPRTRAQLSETCRRRGVPSEATDRLLDRFAELGLVDDEAYAQEWVRSRHAGRRLSRRALRHELTQRGIHRDVIDSALAQVDEGDEREAARALVLARAPSLARYDRATATRRLIGLLGRRGYSPALASVVVREVLGSASSEGDLWQ